MFLLKYAQPLEKCKFISRYKRFFVDVLSQDDSINTVHCANSGSMKSCLVEKAPAYILDSQNPKRKLRYSLELLYLEDGFACLNTARANQFVEELLLKTVGKTKDSIFIERHFPYKIFEKWQSVKREAVFTKETRFDFCLSSDDSNKKCWIEVKSVSMKLNDNTWAFPDAVTTRGQKHLSELIKAKQSGDDAWLFFVLMRGSEVNEDILLNGFRAAYEIDLKYANLLEEAKKMGVCIALIIPKISIDGFSLRKFNCLN
ncbi:DNA/RNA nuclease SfsA [Fluviispira multicolorata]|uniref:Sugar fermentation stimulation protein homolog n=1 Tax=Fluviispira multicolorata TaxID=2654512 RepID=A0A833N1S9_9BACT|nr:DNA/RNA nuclease SfsA [Fluviispira multicolorata]KAB8031085.1 DNA/RNA nuclease SfsA [Fluviispira multicolorata]